MLPTGGSAPSKASRTAHGGMLGGAAIQGWVLQSQAYKQSMVHLPAEPAPTRGPQASSILSLALLCLTTLSHAQEDLGERL